MQTFLPFSDFALSAKVLDNKRLGKQRIEAKQILGINLAVKNSDNFYICAYCCKLIPNKDYEKPCPKCFGTKFEPLEFLRMVNYKIPWENHPAVLMWRGYEYSLALYGFIICDEWKSRGFIDNQQEFFINILKEVTISWNYSPPMIDINYYPKWYRNSLDLWKLCLSHQSNLLRKDWNYYIDYFGENIQDPTLPYYWPVNKEN